MEFGKIFEIIFQVIGGLGIFLYGMHHLSNGLQTVAGEKLKWLIGKVTNNRIFAATIGTLVTMIIQSSSITTVMTVGFVNAGLMTLSQSIGIIMGANIGTTLTGWIIAVKIGKYGLPMLGIAIFVMLFSKNTKVKYIATAIMGLGMIFFGLELMKDGFKPIRSMPEFIKWFHAFSADTYFGVLKCILAGALLTMIVQSSSATLGITIGLATTGIIPFETAAALVLGENIGTTITAFLASFGTKINAKRAAYAHIVFNIIGVTWISLVFVPYLKIVAKIMGHDPHKIAYIAIGIATVHSIFNVTNTLLFLPFTEVLAKFLIKVVPEKDETEVVEMVTHLDKRMLETPMMIIDQTKKEVLNIGEINKKMFEKLKMAVTKGYGEEHKNLKMIFESEDKIDLMQKEISEILTELFSPENSHDLGVDIKKYLKLSDEYESISDYIMKIAKLYLKLKNENIKLSENEEKNMFNLQQEVVEYLDFVNEAVENEKTGIFDEAVEKYKSITKKFKKIRRENFEEVSSGKGKVNPLLLTGYTDILNSYRKIGTHILNSVETLCGETE
ncbi:MAG: hypothetical protein B6I28_02880 [Fusobacteriia bacterium 4572_132]|nr:MAG: hypothetical protein B6I28_02880 [Fusobacteriia bacterium 4572_132]